jgi:predicted nicotinamide N-methyase
MEANAAFVLAHTVWRAVDFVPEISMHLACESTPLWRETSAFVGDAQIEPPFWAFAWPGGVALARHILDHEGLVRGKRVVDVACGGGVVAIAAALAGARSVVAVDVDPLAIAACRLNAARMGVPIDARVGRVESIAELAAVTPDFLITAGDAFYDRAMTTSLLPWLEARARGGARVFMGDPDRPYSPRARGHVLATHDVPVLVDLEGTPAKRTFVLELQAKQA